MAISSPTIPLAAGIKNLRIIIQSNALYPQTKLIPPSSSTPGQGNSVLKQMDDFLLELITGVYRSNVQVMSSGVYATGTATLASTVATNTIVIGGVTLTAVNSGATSVQFNVGATDTITATNLAAAINALTTINKVVQATSSAAIVTIACLVPGTIGNLVTLSAGGGTITVGASLTGGTDGTQGTISHGL